MIDETLEFLRTHLDEHLAAVFPSEGQKKTAYVKYDGDAIKLTEGALSLVLINIEEERTLRPADLHSRPTEDGSRARVYPEIRLILYILFIARFSDNYANAWRHLSWTLEHLQRTRVFTAESASGMPDRLARLGFELVSPSLSEQNEIWSALRTVQHPALLYRVKLLAYCDPAPVAAGKITEIVLTEERLP